MPFQFSKILLSLFFSLFSIYYAHAVDTSQVVIQHFAVDKFQKKTIFLKQSYLGLSVKIKGGSFSEAYFIIDQDTFMLQTYHDSNPEDDFLISQPLINFRFPIEIKLYTGQIHGLIEIHFFKPLPTVAKDYRRVKAGEEDDCKLPQLVGRDIWRKDLPAPTISPTCTEAKHIVLHHSAIPNSAMDYMQQVRFIYTLHTKSNGWDDIGYNYLIDQDGNIYEGRDGQGVCSNDDLKGAHFCAKNDNTLGVCLMGDFTNETPSAAMISSLEILISWKLKKEEINPYAVLEFPRGSGNQLPVIVGHRDGCNTECPGENVYKLIKEITDSTYENIGRCKLMALATPSRHSNHSWVYNNDRAMLTWINSEPSISATINNIWGVQVLSVNEGVGEVDLSRLPAGIYFVQSTSPTPLAGYKFIKQ